MTYVCSSAVEGEVSFSYATYTGPRKPALRQPIERTASTRCADNIARCSLLSHSLVLFPFFRICIYCLCTLHPYLEQYCPGILFQNDMELGSASCKQAAGS